MSLIAIALESGVRRANPAVFCLRGDGAGLRLHHNPYAGPHGRTEAWAMRGYIVCRGGELEGTIFRLQMPWRPERATV